MPSLELMSEVSRDPDLLERLAQCAAVEGVEHPEQWVSMHARQLVSVSCEAGAPQVSISWMWEIGLNYRRENPIADNSRLRWRAMGMDPNVVNDQQLRTAVLNVLTPAAG